jgi:molybdate transport system substrate-binding protein
MRSKLMREFSLKTTFLLMMVGALMLILLGCGGAGQASPETLYVYCGAGMKKPMDEIGQRFEEEHKVKVIYNYAGSGTLLSQMKVRQTGDLYMPGAKHYFEEALQEGLVVAGKDVVMHVPVIAVPKGNPASIHRLADLTKEGVRLGLGDPKACAIGKLANEILAKNHIPQEAVEANVIFRGATVNELVVAVSLGQVDATIVWKSSLVGHGERVEVIPMPKEQNIVEVIPVGILRFCGDRELAEQFVAFVASPEGARIFEKYGFEVPQR